MAKKVVAAVEPAKKKKRKPTARRGAPKPAAKAAVARKPAAKEKVAPKKKAARAPSSVGARFVRADRSQIVGSSKVRSWKPAFPDWDLGHFLGRLWALLGPPDLVQYEGFEYCVRDVEHDVTFTAYAAGSGPAFGAHRATDKTTLAIDAFEDLVNRTSPTTDCGIEFDTDFGRASAGVERGVPFFDVDGDDL